MIEEMIYQNSRLEITLNKLKRFGERFIGWIYERRKDNNNTNMDNSISSSAK